jgi:hypothetical protein
MKVPKALPRTAEEKAHMMQLLAEQEGRLPRIPEEPRHSRRTLDQEDIAALLSTPASESPDIGPPPVSHYINEDPVKFDLPQRQRSEVQEPAAAEPALSVNLEQRRKRKDASNGADRRRSFRIQDDSETAPAPSQTIRSGAKRKLELNDDGKDSIREARVVAVSLGDFKFTRKAHDAKADIDAAEHVPAASTSVPKREVAIPRSRSKDRAATSQPLNSENALGAKDTQKAIAPPVNDLLPPRKALAPKTVNSDIANSPKKIKKPPVGDNADPPSKPLRAKTPRAVVATIETEQAPIAHTVDIMPPPETPAAFDDIFSPASSNTATTRQISRDTPPPGDIGEGQEGHRPSRRARASVSYAEPNLRDKMRRPTKELVDAVTGEGKAKRLSTNILLDDPQSQIKIKQEPSYQDTWSEPANKTTSNVYSNSPLSSKLTAEDGKSSLKARPDPPLRTGSGAAISALMASSRKAKASQSLETGAQELSKTMAKMDIYDFDESSQADTEHSRQTKRGLAQASAYVNDLPSAEGTHRASHLTSKRRQSACVASTNAMGEDKVFSKPTHLSRSASNASLKATLKDSVETETLGRSSSRLGSRRKSMML